MDIFKFKQFSVNQSGCAMKINTDGVLLGAIAEACRPLALLDIGTGTGVIALMLAQRFKNAVIDAVEIDAGAAETATENFKASPFAGRTTIYATDFRTFFTDQAGKKYDLIVSNPPFFLNSLENAGARQSLARHTSEAFYEDLVKLSAMHLTEGGSCQFILPLPTATLVKQLVGKYGLYLHKVVNVKSFERSEPHRQLLVFGNMQQTPVEEAVVIYSDIKVYSAAYRSILKDFLTIF